jgi:hypothetical protein
LSRGRGFNPPCAGIRILAARVFASGWKAGESIETKRGKRQNYHETDVREHGEVEARRMITRWLKQEGMRQKELGAA